MTARLTLLCHAATAATRRATFPDGDALSPEGLAAAAAFAGRLPPVGRVLCSPARCALQTVSALGLAAGEEHGLRECDYGRWRGRSLADLAGAEPDAVAAWLSDPDAAPHGGESLAAVLRRVGAWLDSGAVSGRVLAVTHSAVLRAAAVHALGAPAASFWRLDVEPLSSVQLTSDGRRWNLRLPAAPRWGGSTMAR